MYGWKVIYGGSTGEKGAFGYGGGKKGEKGGVIRASRIVRIPTGAA